MSAGAWMPRRVRHWRDMVTSYDLGNRRPPRRFLDLTLDEQAFVVARIAYREMQAPKSPSAQTTSPGGTR